MHHQQQPAASHRHTARWNQVLWLPLAFAAVYILADWTSIGQSTENALIGGSPDKALIFHLNQAVGVPPLKRGSAVLAAGVVLIAVVGLVRGRRREGVAGIGIVVASVVIAMALPAVLPRPYLVHAPRVIAGASFPSGTTAITAGLVLGIALVTPTRARPAVAALGALWLAVTAAAVQSLSWHRPSDVLGATLLACAIHHVITGLLARGERDERGESDEQGTAKRTRMPPLLSLAPAAVAAVFASAREDSIGRPLLLAAAALACSALVWTTATGRSLRPEPRPH